MAEPFSVRARDNLTETLRSTPYDLLVIGGGITGAGIALDAVSRGFRVALIEKEDFAFGTSSRSTKLIHGGLRYLKQLEFGLVKEVGSERAVVHRLAPHLVVPEKMLLPLYEKKGLGYWLTSIGLIVYDFLAGVRRSDQRRMLTRKQTLRKEPLLRSEGIRGGALYAEYRTDDARLTIEILKTAATRGADVVNYTRCRKFVYREGCIVGAEVVDQCTMATYTISAEVVVNASGPWVDELRILDNSAGGKSLHLTKGVHLVFPHEKLPVKQAIYFQVEDGRMVFAIPRGRTTYVGTTDTNYSASKDRVLTDRDDAEYLVRGINSTFGLNLSVDDAESSWAGLRPLIHEEGKSASELSRKDEIFVSPSGLISIAGGKLTGYRKMAERVVDLVMRKHYQERSWRKCATAAIPLIPDPFKNRRHVRNYLHRVIETLRPYSFDLGQAFQLVETYGTQTEHILRYFVSNDQEGNTELALLKAQAWFAIEYEMVVHLDDFFVRRTGLLYFDVHKVVRYKAAMTDFFQQFLAWDEKRRDEEMGRVEQLINEAVSFRMVVET